METMTLVDTRSARGVVRCEGEYWTISYGGTTCRLRDTTGLRHLAYLLRRPKQRVAATELVHAARSRWAGEPEATGDGAPGRPLVTRVSPAAERARVAVTRAIRTAVQRIAVHNPQLGEHFSATIKTGTCCAYTPDLRLLVAWELDAP